MNRYSVHDVGRLLPCESDKISKQIIPIRGRTPVVTEVQLLSYQSCFFQVFDCPFDSAAGYRQIPCYGIYPRPGLSLLIHAVVEIDIHQLCPMRQIQTVKMIKPAHRPSPLLSALQAQEHPVGVFSVRYAGMRRRFVCPYPAAGSFHSWATPDRL